MHASKFTASMRKEQAKSREQTTRMCRGDLRMMKAGLDVPRRTTADSVDTVA